MSYLNPLTLSERELLYDVVPWLDDYIGRPSFLSFEEARAFVRNLGLKRQDDFREWARSSKRPKFIPTAPERTYPREWVNWGDWLGTGHIGNTARVFRPYKEARRFIRSLHLKSWKDWQRWCYSNKRPLDIPSAPSRVYATEGWKGYRDWFGLPPQTPTLTFKKARTFVRSLKLENNMAWREYMKSKRRLKGLPSAPDKTYKEWISWGDWLGTGAVGVYEFWPFKKARAYVRSLKLKPGEWQEYSDTRRPSYIPAAPRGFYKEFTSQADWMGYDDPFKTKEEHLEIAKWLAKRNKGKLPPQCWMMKHGHKDLVSMLHRHQSWFAERLSQEKAQHSTEHWVAVARDMVKKRGHIPGSKWLARNLSGMWNALRDYPKLFKGFPQEWRGKIVRRA